MTSIDQNGTDMNTPLLKPLGLPLRGPALIEASAGTGKTYTLAMLYLRLILNHGGEAAFGEPLLPHNILVVTFTKAATRELRDRIRQRLVEAAAYLRTQAQPSLAATIKVDELLQELCDTYADEAQQAGAAKRLEMAAEAMDEASISTIHAWCYRVLSEFALHYGGAFEQNLLESETELLKGTSEDFWRLCVLGMSHASLAYMMQRFVGPQTLLGEVRKLLSHGGSLPAASQNLDDHIGQLEGEKKALISKVKADLEASVDELEAYFAEANEAGLYKAAGLNSANKAKALAKIRDFVHSDDSKLEVNKGLQRLAMQDLSIWKDLEQVQVDLLAAKHLAAALDLAEQLPSPDAQILTDACHWFNQHLATKKQQLGLLSNDDLLLRLQQALHGSGGVQLAQAIRQRFPMALVDEFQDTDPVQYDIFNRVYGIRDGCPDAGFIMIGDPKQAIYAFRGGDIYTYLQAREHTSGHHYTLKHNFRSDANLIAAVNGLFSYGDSHALGAFRFRQDSHNPLPFVAVEAGKKTRRQLILDGQAQSSQVAWLAEVDKPGKAIVDKSYVEQMSAATANEVARLLNLSTDNKAVLQEGDQQQPLAPKHMAILVANQKEASAVRKALAQRRIASVYLSDASSVYTTPIAQDVLLLLRAVAHPDDDRLLNMVLPTLLLGLDLADMDALQRDELAWEKQVQRFHGYHQLWQSKGVLALIYQVIFDSHAASRIMSVVGGERLLTDLLHMAELLQQAAMQLDGELSLVRYFETLLDNPDTQDVSQQQRLESDSNLVQVVTIHKSKGLEYPVVFLPFLNKTRLAKSTDMPLVYHDIKHQKQVALVADKAILAAVEHERQTEEIRKLYVALTRASCCQYLGLGEVKNHDKSGLGCLLMLPETVGQLSDYMTTLAQDLPIQPVPEEHTYLPQNTHERQWQGARQAPAIKVKNWYTASYSALNFSSQKDSVSVVGVVEDGVENAPDTAQDAILLEEQHQFVDMDGGAAALEEQAANIHNLPKGALYGTMLHEMLEDCATLGFAEVIANQPARQKIVQAHLLPLELDAWVSAVDEWLLQFLQMPWQLGELSSAPMQLQSLNAQQLLVEMEFLLSTKQVDVRAMDNLVCQHTWQQQTRPQADPKQLNGMLKGYIDLLIEHQGQYFVVDWKSNFLGEDASAYTHEALRDALLHKRYDMQYILYVLALHRLLKSRLPNYDYDQHVGGAVYVFLRGIGNPDTQGLLMDKPAKALIEGLDKLFQGVGGEIV
ncbi:MAG TPA: exodeoxyribonuclease V subunit beta [Oceanospirillaceae bacterium]|nr:exodeoxyribonuclease V subunit beta [Oceanospirillaceae bacterium]